MMQKLAVLITFLAD